MAQRLRPMILQVLGKQESLERLPEARSGVEAQLDEARRLAMQQRMR